MVVAGGSGRRFGGRKQFLQLAGRPVVSWSVRAARSESDGVVVVVPRGASPAPVGGDPATHPASGPAPDPGTEWVSAVDRVVVGGATRADSVRCGLAAVPDDAAIVVVHDAVRPLATPALFAAVIEAVRTGRGEGAVPVLPLTDTLKRVAEGMVTATEDRAGLALVQTPQAFVAGTLRAAHRHQGEATDDAGLLERLGATVCTVPGDPCNLKLTTAGDVALAESLLGARP